MIGKRIGPYEVVAKVGEGPSTSREAISDRHRAELGRAFAVFKQALDDVLARRR